VDMVSVKPRLAPAGNVIIHKRAGDLIFAKH
jgi:hypothetical protein